MHNFPLVGILSTATTPLLPLLLKSLLREGVVNICVILDEKKFNERDKKIWLDRTHGVLDDHGYNIYDFADKHLPFYLVKSHNGDDCISLIKQLKPLVLINAGTPRKLIPSILELPSQGVINVHPGLLPKYRGACCVEWAILNDDPVGNTAHFMSEGYDDGPIIEVESYDLSPDQDYTSIRALVYLRGISMMVRTVIHVLKTGMKPENAIAQQNGKLFPPISDVLMAEVIEKIRLKKYKFTAPSK